jgi:hypothetical protein
VKVTTQAPVVVREAVADLTGAQPVETRPGTPAVTAVTTSPEVAVAQVAQTQLPEPQEPTVAVAAEEDVMQPEVAAARALPTPRP